MNVESSVKIAPSILSADFACLGEQVQEAEKAGADMIHIDIMDGHFVPNITFGPIVVDAIRPSTTLPFDLHLMISNPEAYIEDFIKAGADSLTIHSESTDNLRSAISIIKSHEKRASVAISPQTPLSDVVNVIPEIDQLLVMTVNPGFGGQAFLKEMLEKVNKARDLISELSIPVDIQVDGGINTTTANSAVESGANILVAGSAVFNKTASISESINELRASIS